MDTNIKKPNNYYGHAWDNCEDTYNESFKLSIEGKEIIEKCKENQKKYQKMYIEKGFDNTECWNLDCTIISFSIDKLNNYKKSIKNTNEKQCLKIQEIDKIITGFNSYIKSNVYISNNEQIKEFNNVLNIFLNKYLDKEIATFILPRIIYFKNNTHGYPNFLTADKWEDILNKIITSLNNIKDNKYIDTNDTKNGLKLLKKHFSSLWD